MNKWNMIIDVAECTNCNLCTLAAMDEYVGNEFPGYSAPMPKHGHKWIDILQKERGQLPTIDIAYVPTMCNHCDNAPCVAKGGGAVNKRDDGIVLIDPVKAKGRKDLVEACPYGHIWWNEELQLPQAWTFDAHLIDQGWKQTRGQQSCPTGAMRAICVDDDEMASSRASRGSKPSSRSSAPSRASTTRICGATRHASSAARCRRRRMASSIASRARTVRLLKNGAVVAQAATDNYGDFKFDRLDENSGEYVVEISAAGQANKDRQREARRQHQSRRNQAISFCLPDPSIPLVFPQLGALYQTLAPVAEALCASGSGWRWCRTACAIPSTASPPPGSRCAASGCSPTTWTSRAIARASCGRRRSRRRNSSAGRCWRSACSRGSRPCRSCCFLLVSNIERWRVGKYFWNQLGLEYTLMWTVAALYFLVHGGGTYSLDHLIMGREF